MNEKKLGGLIGLALRARQAETGAESSRMLIKAGKCGVLLVDEQAATNTREKAEALCRQSGIGMILIPEGIISSYTGKSSMILAVKRGSFAGEIIRLSQEDSQTDSITS